MFLSWLVSFMNFLHPGAWVWAAVAVPIVLAYLRKIRSRRIPVSTTLFWQQAVGPRDQKPAFRQLSHVLSLLLQLLFVVLLTLAIAEWTAADVRQPPQRVVLVLDNSASMRVSDVSPDRFGAAQARALHLIRSMRPADQLSLVTTARPTRVQCPLTGDATELTERLRAISAQAEEGEMEAAVQLARQILASSRDLATGSPQPTDRLIVLTDACFDASPPLSADSAIHWSIVGAPADNVAITAYQVRRSVVDPQSSEAFTEVSNPGTRTIRCQLNLDLNDRPIDVVPLTLEPGSRTRHVTTFQSAEGGLLKASLQFEEQDAGGEESRLPGNVLSADDVAEIQLPARSSIPVTLVTPGNVFLQQVLQALPGVALTVTDQLPAVAPPSGVLILHSQSVDPIPDGHVVVIDPRSSSDLWNIIGPATQPRITEVDQQSPLLRNVELQECGFSAAAALQPVGDHQVLAAARDNSPMMLLFRRPAGDALLLPFRLENSDLPLRTAFPILFANLLASRFADDAPVVADASLLSAAESNLQQRSLMSADEQTLLVPTAPSLPITMILILTALSLTMCEWWMYHRRWVR